MVIDRIVAGWAAGRAPSREEALALTGASELPRMLEAASTLRDQGFGGVVTFSKKVFLPLTHLCRDICHYCVFARPPRRGEAAYMTRELILEQAGAAAAAGCKEALFTLGDKPERRYRAAREGLAELGHATTLEYLREAAQLVFEKTGLLPHLNPGLMTADDFAALRPVSASMGIMLESVSARLNEKGGAHYGSPDKVPARRLETLRLAGEARVPFTTGILIGIGETRRERIESLLAIRELHEMHGHIQEIIIQNFRAKPETRMADHPEPSLDDLLWTIAMARLVCGPRMSVQAPPNLSPGALEQIVAAGINDWGGVSPITPDFVNPEAPWPHLERLAEETARAGKLLQERLTVYPSYALDGETWLDDAIRPRVLEMMDADGLARVESWSPGAVIDPPAVDLARVAAASALRSDVGEQLACSRTGAASCAPTAERRCAGRGDPRDSRPCATRPGPLRRRNRHALPRPRRRLRSGGARGRRGAARDARRRRHLRRQPQHQLHQRLLLQVSVLRLLQRKAR